MAGIFDEATANATIIQYGGSVKPNNATELMGKPDIDGCVQETEKFLNAIIEEHSMSPTVFDIEKTLRILLETTNV